MLSNFAVHAFINIKMDRTFGNPSRGHRGNGPALLAKKVYSFEQRQFQINVVKSIRGVFEDLQMNDAPGISIKDLIDAPADNYFSFKADTIPPKDSLVFYIQESLPISGCSQIASWGPTASRKINMFTKSSSLPPLPLCGDQALFAGPSGLYQGL